MSKIMLITEDFHYHGAVEYDYDYSTHCGEDGNYCHEEGICRCGTIENARVTKVNVPSVLDCLCPKWATTVMRYCVDRLITQARIYDPDLWEVGVRGGYYGEETGSITFCPSNINAVAESISKVWSLKSNRERLMMVMQQEYKGAMIEFPKKFQMKTVPTDKLVFLNKHHLKLLDEAALKRYENWSTDLPIAMCCSDQEYYRVMDGYHRCQAAINRGDKVVKVLYARHWQ